MTLLTVLITECIKVKVAKSEVFSKQASIGFLKTFYSFFIGLFSYEILKKQIRISMCLFR